MKEILQTMFSSIRTDIIPERGMIQLTIGEDDDGLIAAYEKETDNGEWFIHLENIVSFTPGYGSKLMSEFISKCREAEYEGIEVIVFPLYENPRFWQYQRLLRWYEKFGFNYANEADVKAAQEIYNQPGELLLNDYEKELRHPKMILILKDTQE